MVSINPIPEHGEINVVLSPNLSIDVGDEDGDDLTVSFYNAFDDSLIGSNTILGGTGISNITWSNLDSGSKYFWYVFVDDGLSTSTSSIFSFETLTQDGNQGGEFIGINTFIPIGAISAIAFISIAVYFWKRKIDLN